MKLSKKGEYGLRALCYLARHATEGAVPIRTIAETEGIPVKFLESILLQLKRSGLVASRRGMRGGYQLAKPPEAVPVGTVVRILDGPISPLGTGQGLRRLLESESPEPGLYRFLLEVRDQTAALLDRTTLADLTPRGRYGRLAAGESRFAS